MLAAPAARALKKLFPEAAIDFLAEPPGHEALEGDPCVSRVLVYGPYPGAGRNPAPEASMLGWMLRLRRERYDWVIDFMGNPRTAILTASSGARVRAGPAHVFHRWAYSHRMRQSPRPCYAAQEKIRWLRSLGLPVDDLDFMPRLRVATRSRDWAKEALAGLAPRGTQAWVGLVPASRRETRRWPAAAYARLGRMLREASGVRLLVFWGPGERSLAAGIAEQIGEGAASSPPTRSLQDLAALLETCRLVVTNCNGPKHIAVALGVPTLTIHGSSDPVCWNPPDRSKHPIERIGELHCIGCRLNRCSYGLECLGELRAERVASRALAMLRDAAGLPSP